ncbi:sulfurtransferase [Luteimonas abyssi]|uniref:sulfurtransferase n=1 Tax=Luteimonas abyssi TaxID=1247514 RepID=UPI000737D248|nr:sulfurtransferase [Luteimonas abyssi]
MYASIAAYRFVSIEDPRAVADAIRDRAQARALLGSVLVAGEGVNLFLAGTADDIAGFLGWLRADPRLADIEVKHSSSATRPFARLKVKVKAEIIAFRRDDASPLDGRAPSVAPEILARWIERGTDDAGRRLVLLDTRNREEVGHGTFAGATTLPIDNFTDLPDAVDALRDSLADAAVVSFCTGGIRCEKAALWMQARGMDNVLQLDGGILGYFERVGGHGYDGGCFVFDERVALAPDLSAMADATASGEGA